MTLHRPVSITALFSICCLLSMPDTGLSEELSDPYGGYRVEVNDADGWTSQLTNTPGFTSRLCLLRHSPQLIVCFQGINRPLPPGDVAELARGFVDGVAEALDGEVQGELVAQSFTELSGFSQRLVLRQSEALTDVWMFAGVGPSGQIQSALAFYAPEEREASQPLVLAIVDSLRYGGDPI